MKLISKRQLDLILQLSDEEGYSHTELVKKLNMKGPNVTTNIDALVDQSIIYWKGDKETKEKKKKEKKDAGQGIFYYIGPSATASPEEKLDVFRIILKSSLDLKLSSKLKSSLNLKSDLQEKLLASKYVNSLIATCGIMSFYEIIEEYMEQKEFQRIASHALLSQPALIEEYKTLAESMKERMESYKEGKRNPTSYSSNNVHLKFLSKCDALESVRFYRAYLANDFAKLYGELADMENMQSLNQNITEHIKKLVELDLFLSPLTSFPRKNPFNLLFAKPFERLYSDIYICDDSDYQIMANRAYLIYSNFAEILRAGIMSMKHKEDSWEWVTKFLAKSDEDYLNAKKSQFIRSLRRDLFYKKDNLNNLIKELIFYWNIASLRLDFIYCNEIAYRRRWGGSGGRYHLLASSNGIQAIHIDEDKSSGPEMTSEDMIITSLWCGESDPFSNLRYCYCFKDLNLEEKQTSVEEIASALENIY